MALSPLSSFDGHARAAFATAPLETDPFPHMVVPDVFPEADYRKALAALPAAQEWVDAGRHRVNWEIATDQASESTTQVWHYIDREVAPQVLKPLLLDRFRPPLSAYWRERGFDPLEVERTYYCDEGRLMLRRPGYKLTPHLDPGHAVLTILIYLARPGDDERFGTDLYRATGLPRIHKDIFKAAEHGIAHELVKTVPFRANTLLAFMTPVGLHGAAFPESAAFERVTYQWQVRIDKAMRKQMLVREGLLSSSSQP